MPDAPDPAPRAAAYTAFATLGTLSTAQDLARALLAGVDGAEPELVAEESLCLTAVATARAAEVGFRDAPELRAAVLPALLDLPFAYRDYLLGAALLADPEASVTDESEAMQARLGRKLEFYATHFPAGRFPGERALQDKMELWMGRVSPPRLPEMPARRLERLCCSRTCA